MPQIYCAGPLFNQAEKEEMSKIAEAMERARYATFLPQRDGLEHKDLLPELKKLGGDPSKANETLERAIFSLDIYQLLSRSDGVVANLNGRVPDEGTVVEASLAWHSGKALVLYKADARTVFDGSDNPMLVGLGDFRVVDDIGKLAEALAQQLAVRKPSPIPAKLQWGEHSRIPAILQWGEQIATFLEEKPGVSEIAQMLLSSSNLFRGVTHETL